MKLTFKNIDLKAIIEFLQEIELEAAESRHRSKLVKLLLEAYKELSEDEKELMKECNLLTEEGKLKEEEDRNPDDIMAFNAKQNELLQEEVVIDGGAYVNNIRKVEAILTNYDGKLSGEKAEIYDKLLDEFEKNEKDAK